MDAVSDLLSLFELFDLDFPSRQHLEEFARTPLLQICKYNMRIEIMTFMVIISWACESI